MKKIGWMTLVIIMVMVSIVGCSEKKEAEQVSTESKDKNEKNAVSKIVGNWNNDDTYITIKKNNDNIVMSLEDDGNHWDLTLETQRVQGNKVEATVVNSSSKAQERSIGLKMTLQLKSNGDLEMIADNKPIKLQKATESRSAWEQQKGKEKATRDELLGELETLVKKNWINEEISRVWYAGDEITFTYFEDSSMDSPGLNIKINKVSNNEYKGKVVNSTKNSNWNGKDATIKTTGNGGLDVYVGNAKKLTLKSADLESTKYKNELTGNWINKQNNQQFFMMVSDNEISMRASDDKSLKIGIFDTEGNVLKGKVAGAPGENYKTEWFGKPVEISLKSANEIELTVNKKEKLVLTK
ncbi:hypothetical protein [Bacillus cereus group sp. TH152-1LC]|uniref:hypothetical protein n=1 Tax=Bacillus cereus group sp. TH152-1LC TaxID=3018060 RepID=UPI0022E20691|nr:hypothetical protein [Bacillus cereus group sp. TH152-1LC]MDA1675368.1 hypothetical protein [Bacillus cereus group sp. TH152-1LC]